MKRIRAETAELAKAVDIFQKAGFKAWSCVVEAEIRQGILEVASEWGASLIVVTSHARSGQVLSSQRSGSGCPSGELFGIRSERGPRSSGVTAWFEAVSHLRCATVAGIERFL